MCYITCLCLLLFSQSVRRLGERSGRDLGNCSRGALLGGQISAYGADAHSQRQLFGQSGRPRDQEGAPAPPRTPPRKPLRGYSVASLIRRTRAAERNRKKMCKVQNATFGRIKPNVPGFGRIGIRFNQIPGRSAQFAQKWQK